MPNDLTLITPEQLPSNLTAAEMTRVLDYTANATAESTRVAYDQDMAQFRHWCTARGACALPASPAMVAAYLAHLADSGRRASGIGRAAAGIAWHHKQAGIDPAPTAHGSGQTDHARHQAKNRLRQARQSARSPPRMTSSAR